MASQKIDIEDIVGKSGQRRGKWLRRLLAIALGISVFGGAWYWQTQRDADDAAAYVTEPATRGDITVLVTATGTVEPTTSVDISSELSGTIDSVEVDYNDTVKVGQVLARLDTTQLQATVAHGRAALAAAPPASRRHRPIWTKRAKHLVGHKALELRGFTSQEALITAQAAFDRANAALDIAKADRDVAAADLQVSEANLTKACICSPINGIVLDRDVDPGQIVAASLQAPVLFTLAEDLRRMELLVDVDEADIGVVAVGDAATFTVEAWQDRTFPAQISELRYAPANRGRGGDLQGRSVDRQ